MTAEELRQLEAAERANCPACIGQRCHTKEEDAAHHPRTGHGFSPETGWTHPDLKSANESLRDIPKR